ncbi:hypothetical protein BB559_004307 [Furculomyces boomerangus]|uniref:Uncharacterized protein n=1 Tax=Furculomyces boomerangus TaxID=61424 RepID=A0A2T9YFH2_9FUNG|nr:hypothetical protein BB559_004307 [Furculomyces boomerangus]
MAEENISDPRFKHIEKDPRFLRPSQRKNKFVVDERFASRLEGSEFMQKVDKYGRKKKDSKLKAQLNRFYVFDKDTKEPKAGSSSETTENSSSESESSSSESEPETKLKGTQKKRIDRARGEGISDESSDSSSDESVDTDVADIYDDKDVQVGETRTNRIAAVNMDWENLRAVDLLASFTGFKPASGSVLSIKIYISDFGKERIKAETEQGPPTNVYSNETKKKPIEYEEGDGFDQSSLRKYELEKLKYYYAIAECDSVETASAIYDNCDSTEFESSANQFDLRFVPDETEFADEPVDVATRVPDNYKPIEFVTTALQHSRVKLTWDAEDPKRVQIIKKAFTKDEIDDMDYKAFVASSGSDSDESGGEGKNRRADEYRKLLLSGLGESGGVFDRKGRNNKEEGSSGEDEGGMEITFTPGLSNRVDKNDFFEVSEDSEEETEGRKGETRGRRGEVKENKKIDKKEEREKKEAELELLMMDDEMSKQKHFDLKQIVKSEKKVRGKKGKRNARELEDLQEDFQIDTNDPRFASIYNSSEFAIDPNSKSFKKTKGMSSLLSERRKRHGNSHN